MTLSARIGYAFLLSVFSLLLAAAAPSRYTLTLSAIITTGAILFVAYAILADDDGQQDDQ